MRRRDALPYEEPDAPFWLLLAVVLAVFVLALVGLWAIAPLLS